MLRPKINRETRPFVVVITSGQRGRQLTYYYSSM